MFEVEDSTCRECQYEGKTGDDLNVHMVTHRVYKCGICEFETKISIDFPLHMKVHEEIVVDLTEEAPKANKPEVILETKTCPLCKLESKDLEALRTHIENIHQTGFNNPETMESINDEIIRVSSETVNNGNPYKRNIWLSYNLWGMWSNFTRLY